MNHQADFRRSGWRAAQKIHDHLGAMRPLAENLDLPTDEWNELVTSTERLRNVMARGWHVAGERVLDEVVYILQRLQHELDSFRRQLPSTPLRSNVLTTSEITAELAALEAEFEDVDLDLQERSIAVSTEAIVLEGVYLGAFRITLHWERIGADHSYEVEAREPNPAEGDDDVPHPHVRDGQLCEGEGKTPIKNALAQGRLVDFFMLVAQTLRTYNGGSAYVSLDRWDGVSCRDCGSRMSRDEQGRCERCDDPLCTDCSRWCESCEVFSCSNCCTECDGCGSFHCTNCIITCAHSNRHLCQNCLESEQENDNDLQQDSEAEDSAIEPQRQQELVAAASPLHSLRVGQVAISA